MLAKHIIPLDPTSAFFCFLFIYIFSDNIHLYLLLFSRVPKYIILILQKIKFEEQKSLRHNPTPQQMPPVNQPYVVVFDALAKFIGVQGTVPHDDALK
jgi:hypothetical protein